MSKVHLLSLGCPKNLVDSENLLNKLKDKGIYYTSSAEDSDVIIVNTCGFIDDARRESIEEILRTAEIKGKRKRKKLIVFGCLAEKFGEELKREIPEIDALWGVGREEDIVAYCEKNISNGCLQDAGEKLTNTPYAYLKIAEGCNRGCSYCAIPGIRGAYRSVDPAKIVAEAERLIRSDKKELIIIAQDITSYGGEIRGYDLSRLIRDISSLGGDFRIRLLYLYPTSIDERLLETIAATEKVCKYIDMPLQHSEEKILKLMKRGGGRDYFEKLISHIREIIPDVTLRTTLIAGFPQETEADFEGMAEFVRRVKFDRLGVFKYSKEKGTLAAGLKGQVPARIKNERYNKIMEIQSAISFEKNEKLVGKTFRALVDEVDNGIAVARTCSQAPDIDGVVLIEDKDVEKGCFIDIEIKEAYDYDLKGIIAR